MTPSVATARESRQLSTAWGEWSSGVGAVDVVCLVLCFQQVAVCGAWNAAAGDECEWRLVGDDLFHTFHLLSAGSSYGDGREPGETYARFDWLLYEGSRTKKLERVRDAPAAVAHATLTLRAIVCENFFSYKLHAFHTQNIEADLSANHVEQLQIFHHVALSTIFPLKISHRYPAQH